MTTKFKLLLITLITLVVTGIAYILNLSHKTKELNNKVQSLEDQKVNNYTALVSKLTQSYEIAGIDLKPALELKLTDSLKQQTTLEKVLKSGDKIILFFSQLHCNECIEKEIAQMNDVSDKPQKIKADIVVITHHIDPQYFNNFLKFHKVKAKIYSCGNNYLKIPYDKYGAPFILFATKEGLIKSGYVSDKDFSENRKLFYSKMF